jgi:hypothetical protein
LDNSNLKQYKVEKVGQCYNLTLNGDHFLTIINQVGTFNLRAHPGKDQNGWGTSVYLQAFMPGAILHSAKVKKIIANANGIYVEAVGSVCLEKKKNTGKWSVNLTLSYDFDSEKIKGVGRYQINLKQTLRKTKKGDLNLMKIASNYLWNTPHLDNTKGNTGDMSSVNFEFDGNINKWIPKDMDSTIYYDSSVSCDDLRIRVNGGLNSCDSRKQGFDPISSAAAYKPTIAVKLKSLQTDKSLKAFAMFSTHKDEMASIQYEREVYLYEEYWQDNIGINPIINRDFDSKKFTFQIEFEAVSTEPATRETLTTK